MCWQRLGTVHDRRRAVVKRPVSRAVCVSQWRRLLPCVLAPVRRSDRVAHRMVISVGHGRTREAAGLRVRTCETVGSAIRVRSSCRRRRWSPPVRAGEAGSGSRGRPRTVTGAAVMPMAVLLSPRPHVAAVAIGMVMAAVAMVVATVSAGMWMAAVGMPAVVGTVGGVQGKVQATVAAGGPGTAADAAVGAARGIQRGRSARA